MSKKYDTIILGGGIIGCSTAFYLSKKGQRVLVLEKGSLGQEASSAAAGMLGVQTELEEESPIYELARKSREMFPNLAEELKDMTGIDIGLSQKGTMRLAFSEEQRADYREIAVNQKLKGEESFWKDKEEIVGMEPCLTDSLFGGIWFPKEGHVSAPDLTQAFARAAAVNGVTFRESADVYQLIFHQNQVVGAATDTGDFYGSAVLVAAGAWSRRFLLGEEQALYPVKGEALSVKTEKAMLHTTIFTDDCYLVPKKGGEIIVGATSTPHTFDKRVTMEGIGGLIHKAKRLLPLLGRAEIDRIWAGTRPMTGDGLPIMGAHPDLSNLYFSTGHYRNGILLSPITGKVMADYIAEEATLITDLSAFKPERFQYQTEVSPL
ncbi:glycine oxidase ThiO [Halobacillus halophilus]|uniref:glycine oxidase ThiO n=1 Tax=Halobacillus halophilus TaxID=1570 RepID=UPI001CD386CD|nr:glycine oxidase ThiO [Halobacillus halophilus]MCA1009585.1 glycine oxidase ThiO [Halobacillus halophilus]